MAKIWRRHQYFLFFFSSLVLTGVFVIARPPALAANPANITDVVVIPAIRAVDAGKDALTYAKASGVPNGTTVEFFVSSALPSGVKAAWLSGSNCTISSGTCGRTVTFSTSAVAATVTYTITITAKGSNEDTVNFSLTVNDIAPPNAPTVSGTSPTTDTTPTWTWLSGGGGNGAYRYKLDNSDLTTGATQTASASYTPTSGLSLADHTLYVQERDAAGNWSASGSRTISIVSPVTATISASPYFITSGSVSILTWSSTGASSCDATGGWSGAKATSGTQAVTPSVDTSYAINCTGPGGTDGAVAIVWLKPDAPVLVSPPNNSWTNSRQFCARVTSGYAPYGLKARFDGMAFGTKYGNTVSSGQNSCYTHNTDLNLASWNARVYRIDVNGNITTALVSDASSFWTAKIEQQNPTCAASFDNNSNITSASAACSDTGGSGCTGNPANQTVNAAGTYTFNVTDNADNTGSCATSQAYVHYSYGSWTTSSCGDWNTTSHTRSCTQTRTETVTYSTTSPSDTRLSTTQTITETDTAAPPAPAWASGSSTLSPTKETNPTVAWNAVADNGGPDVSGVSYYYIDIYKGATQCDYGTIPGTSTTLGNNLPGNSISCGSGDGSYNFYARAIDSAGNQSAVSSVWNVIIDTQAPAVSSVTATNTTNQPTCETVRFTVNGAQDNSPGAGLHASPYSFDAGANWRSSNTKDFTGASKTLAANAIKVRDKLDNIYSHDSAVSGSSSACDSAGPTLNYSPNGSGGWKTAVTVITLTVSDASGVGAAKYNWDGAASATVGTDFINNAGINSPAGSHTLYLWARDTLNNPNTLGPSAAYQYDDAAPTFAITDNANASWNSSDTIAVTVSDGNGSGPSATTYWGYSSDAVCNASDSYPSTGLSATVNTTHTDYICFRNTDAVNRIGYSSAIGALKVDAAAPSTPVITCGSYTSNVWRDDTAPTCTWTNPDIGPSPTAYYYCATSGCDPNTADPDRSIPTTFGNGANYFRAKNCDTGGCSPTAEFIVKRDQTAPTGGSVGNTNGYQTATAIAVSVNRGVDNESDMSTANANYLLEVASAALSNGACGAYSAYADANVSETATASSYTYTGLNAKCYKFRYTAKNTLGLASTYSGTDVTKIDTTPPSKPALTPSTSYNYTGSFTITWPASTDAASGVSYYYIAQSSDFGSSYAAARPSQINSPSTSWSPSSSLAQGSYRYTVRAYDKAGNQSAPPAASEYLGDVVVDKTAPTLATFDVQPRTANPDGSFAITRTASDSGGSGIDRYETWRAPDSGGSPGTWTNLGDKTTDIPSPGTYWYGIHIIDRATNCITDDTGSTGTGGHCGGVSSDSVIRPDKGPIKVTKLSDITPPTISSITSITADGAYNAGKAINITVNFSEPVTSTGNTTVTLETGTTDRSCVISAIATPVSSASCTYTVQTGDNSSDLTVNTITGAIKDAVNNSMTNFVPTTNLSASKAIVIDTIAPGTTNGETITITLSPRNTSSTEVKNSTTAGYTYNTFPTRVPTAPDNKPSYTITCTGCNNLGSDNPRIINTGLNVNTLCNSFDPAIGSCTRGPTSLTINLNDTGTTDRNRNGTWQVQKSFFKDPAGNPAGTASEYFSFTVNNLPPTILP